MHAHLKPSMRACARSIASLDLLMQGASSAIAAVPPKVTAADMSPAQAGLEMCVCCGLWCTSLSPCSRHQSHVLLIACAACKQPCCKDLVVMA